MAVLVTGGAGYIGSHTVACLRSAGRDVVVIDDLSSGSPERVPSDVPIVIADVGDRHAVRDAIDAHDVDAIVHFAGRIRVGESVDDPRLYWRDNLAATVALLDAALERGVRSFVFSSSAAVYGTPSATPISESDPLAPINPYGETKAAVERMLAAYGAAYGLRWIALRYFNAAGAAHGLAEQHEPETHLVPLVLDVALGRRPHVALFGADHATPDGTCVRDYVHVADLADAHVAALAHLARGGDSGALNLGTGVGHSVSEVIATCREVTERDIPVVVGPRRAGDPPSLVASPSRARRVLGWSAKRSLHDIVRDAYIARSATASPPEPKEQAHAR